MDSKHHQQQMGGDDLPSPGVQGFKDWTSKATKDTPQGGSREAHHYDDPMMSMKLNEVHTLLLEHTNSLLTEYPRARWLSLWAHALK